jgi:hypothetical protein
VTVRRCVLGAGRAQGWPLTRATAEL